jgi:signal transduction histidine kinase
MRRRLERRTLLTHLALTIIAPLALTMLGLLIVGGLIFQQLVASLVFARDSELGDVAAASLRNELGEYSDALQRRARDSDLTASSIETRNAALRDALARLNDTAIRRLPYYTDLALLAADGEVRGATSQAAEQLALAAWSDLHAAPEPIDAVVSNVLMKPGTGETLVAIGVPTASEQGSESPLLLGFIQVYDSELTEVLASLTVGGSGYAYLVDRNGHVIYHPDVSVLGANYSDRSYVQHVIAGESGGTLWDSPEGDRWIVDYTAIPQAGWGLVVKEPRDVVIAPAEAYLAMLVVLGIAVVLVVLLNLWLAVRRIAAPIQWLSEQTTRLADQQEVTAINTSGIVEFDGLSQAFLQMAQQIASYRSSLRRYIGLITRSQDDERRRIARELHDETVQNLISVVRRIELLEATVAHPEQQAQWASIRKVVADTAHGVRLISRDLRPPMLEDLGLVHALETLVSHPPDGAGGMPNVTLQLGGAARPLDRELEWMLYRIAQEALNNVRRHAQARQAELQLNFVNGSVQLAVIDDGQGFEKPASFTALVQRGSLGLMGIQERVWAAGGSLAIDSAPGQGTQLRVTFPANYSAARA